MSAPSTTVGNEKNGATDAPVLVIVDGVAANASPASEPRLRDVPDHDAVLRVTDLGVTRGDGVFETIGVFDGAPVNLDPHLQRLAHSGGLIELPDLDLDLLAGAVEHAISRHASVPELTVRVIVTRGDELGGGPTAWVHARTADDFAEQRRGIAVVTLDRGVATTVAETSPWLLAGAKTLSYAVNMAAIREAHRRGADDALFVSSDGFCLEGPTSTLLVRTGGAYVTTPVSAGVLPGTSVASLVTDLRANGAACSERLLRPAEVAEAEAAWLLSSSRLAAPIRRLDDTDLAVDLEATDRFTQVLQGRV